MKIRTKALLKRFVEWTAVTMMACAVLLAPVTGFAAAAEVESPRFQQPYTKVMTAGETYQAELLHVPEEAEIEWQSSDEHIATVNESGLVEAVSAGLATIAARISIDEQIVIVSKHIMVREAPEVEAKPLGITVNEHGFDTNGRMTALFGSPVVDGVIDPIWEKAIPVKQTIVAGKTDTTAVFRALWDDRALYILAEVKDQHLSVAAEAPYMQDSLEIFLDENNDKTVTYGPDDLHLRVNYENMRTVDQGESDRFYTAATRMDDGYIIEARVALTEPPENGKVLGIELQINDAVEAERAATLNVFDATGTAWSNPSTFGEIVLLGKSEGDVSGPNPYDLLSLIERTMKMNFKLYQNPHVVTDAVMQVVASHFLKSGSFTQEELDEQYAAIVAAIDQLEMTEEAANEKYFTPMPGEYRMPSDRPGTIERLTYKTPNAENGMDEKKLNIYLPHGYDPNDKDTKYNVLYLMHGGGENEDLLFGGPGENRELKNILDNMIAAGEIDPLIVVTPTFYGGMNDVALFHEELINDIVPLVETTYNTYAKSGSLEDLQASRAHRAFGGFSMGSVTTWHVFANKLDYFKYFIPLSGDSWALGERSGGIKPRETAEFLANVARESDYEPQDYYIFSATGDLDIAYPNLKPQIDAMRLMTDVFIYSSDKTKGNFYFLVAEGGSHSWNWQNQYIYHILPDLFD